MIPLHRPPFGFRTVMAAALAGGGRASLQELESAYATVAGMPAVWLPSARAGIGWALRVATDAETTILAPAFTCGVVHEVLANAGGRVKWFEPDTAELLVSPARFTPPPTGRHALLLCEVYGHTYDLAQLSPPAAAPPVLRIVDMAMAVPHAALFARLAPDDFAVISFGTGKNMYAGWGAMGFTRHSSLAREIVRLRDAALAPATLPLAARRALEAGARVIGNQPAMHALARRLRDALRPGDAGGAAGAATGKPFSANLPNSPEWTRSSTRVDRGLALWNLEHAPAAHAARVRLAERYRQNLTGATGIRCPGPAVDALSHFTVQVDARIRDRVKGQLGAKGINTVTLWAFSARLNPREFPRAFRASAEVLNLPLSPWMTEAQVDFVCGALRRSVEQAAAAPAHG